MDRSTLPYLALHYLLLLLVIFLVIAGIEAIGLAMPLWVGILLAIAIGLAYPMAVRSLGVAPEQWE